MEQIIINQPDGSKTPLISRGKASAVTKAEQSVGLLGVDTVAITVKTANPLNFTLGGYIDVFGKEYTLNQLPSIKKTGTRKLEYTLTFEGVQYELIDAQWLLPADTVLDSFKGDLEDFLDILIGNINRVFPGKWVKGIFPADTESKTLTYTEKNCLEVLQDLCEQYSTEFEITQANGVRTLNIKTAGVNFPYTFRYGRTGGLYELTRQNINSKNVVTRLYVYGGSNNLGSKYRYSKLCLPLKEKNASYIENTAAIEAFGLKENTKTFDKIYPKRVGEVSALGDGVRHFIDNTMNFDLNELEEDGKTTKWLINQVKPKVKFTTGNLAGYEFECSYKHETKTITIDPFTDENGMEFPSKTSAAFQFGPGDEYIFTDINLPDAYKEEAEAKLQEEGETYYNQYCQPQVQYALSIDQNFIKQFAGQLTVVNLFGVGDYIHVEDDDLGVNKSIRITAFTRDLLQPYKYSITLGDAVTKTVITRVIEDLQKIDTVIEINNLADPSKARRNWRSSQEVLANVFDPEGNYFSEKIKPLSIETSMLAVGAKSMQFILQNTLIEANYEGNKNAVKVTGGTLAHYTISENTRYWSLASASTTLTSDAEAYYIYGKCQKDGNSGTIIFSNTQIKVNEDPLNYHFWIGVINSVDDGVRAISLTYGSTTVNGRYIKTGRIESGDGRTYFDLDNSEIAGKISFISIDDQKVEMGAYADSVTEEIDKAKAEAEEKKRVFVETPYTPYDIGDLWVDGEVLRRCLTKKPSGNFDPNHWVLAVYYDNTKTVINGGVVTSGTIQLAGSEQAILAGITGEGVSNDSVRIWAGASKENRGTAPYRVLQDGSIIGTKGMIGGLTIEMNRLISQGERVEINGNDSIIALRDENGNIKTIIHPNDIKSIETYFDTGGSYNADLSYLNSNNFTGANAVSLTIGGSSSETHELTIGGFDIETHLSINMGFDMDPDEYAEASTIVELVKDGVVMLRLAEVDAASYADAGGAVAYGGMQSRTFTVPGNATYSVRVVHSIQQPGGNATATSFAKIIGMTTMEAGRVVNRSEIGNNGMVIATSNQNYTYMVDNLYEVRRGIVGFRVTPTGIQKSTNMNTATPTWTNI